MKTLGLNFLCKLFFLTIISSQIFINYCNAQVIVSGSHPLSNGTYSSLGQATQYINTNNQSGYDIEVSIYASYLENQQCEFTDGLWNSLTIFPTTTGITIQAMVAGLIVLNGADNVTIDGRANRTGNNPDLTIENLSSMQSPNNNIIRFENSAQNNTIQYCTFKGSIVFPTGGLIHFAQSSTGDGNSNNRIEYCNFTNADNSRPESVIYSLGSSGRINENNIISNNNFYNIIKSSFYQNSCIRIGNFSNNFSISNNHFYETDTLFLMTECNYSTILIENGDHTIDGNYIGGSNRFCNGSPMLFAAPLATSLQIDITFTPIKVNPAANSTKNIITNNTISNIRIERSYAAEAFIGISATGDVEVMGNTIGSDTLTSSIYVLSNNQSNTSIPGISGIYHSNANAAYETEISNNIISGIETNNTETIAGMAVYGIRIVTNASSPTINVTNNTIGNKNIHQSILLSGKALSKAQAFIGIGTIGTGEVLISENNIHNIHNDSERINATQTNYTSGIYNTGNTSSIIHNNTISKLSHKSANSNEEVPSICGIVNTSSSNYCIITNNTIHNLYNTSEINSIVHVKGIYHKSSIASNGTTISGNFIYNLNISPLNTTGNSSITGIDINYSAGHSSNDDLLIYNNIIHLGDSLENDCFLSGISTHGSSLNDKIISLNTIMISGQSTSNFPKTAFRSTSSSNFEELTNNILINNRTNIGGSSGSYCIYINTSFPHMSDYNNINVQASGGKAAYWGTFGELSNLQDIQNTTGTNLHSVSIDPKYSNAILPTLAIHYKPRSLFFITRGDYESFAYDYTDYFGTFRNAPPSMGAIEFEPGAEGSYTIGTNGDFLTLTGENGFFHGINTSGMKENVTIYITEDLTELGTHPLNEWIEKGSGEYSLTITTDTNTLRTIAGNYNGGLIRFSGADRVCLDGSFNGNGRYISIANNSILANTAAVQIISLGENAGATNNTIKNCIISGGSESVTSIFGIYVAGPTISTTGGGRHNHHTKIENNIFKKAGRAIYVAGTSNFNSDSILIINNIIGQNGVGEQIMTYGIETSFSSGKIMYNSISNIKTTATNNAPRGIYLSTGSKNYIISHNEIFDIENTRSGNGGTGGAAIELNTFSASHTIVSNNIIHGLGGRFNMAFIKNIWGIVIGSGENFKIINNTININKDAIPVSSSNEIHGGIYISNTPEHILIANNIISVTAKPGDTIQGKMYGIFSHSPLSAFDMCDYNNIYANGNTHYCGFLNNDISTLTEWQTQTGFDLHSASTNPEFHSNSNLQPLPGHFITGVYFQEVSIDFNNIHRSNPPDMGAYEGSENGRWIGGISSDWNNMENWDDLQIPNASTHAHIGNRAQHMPEINNQGFSPALCMTLLIENNASLKVLPGKAITIGQDILNYGLLHLQSDSAEGTATLIHGGQIHPTGTCIASQFISAGRNWYISSPVTTATANVFDVEETNKMWAYDETGTNPSTWWSEISQNSQLLTPTIGYIAHTFTSEPYSFSSPTFNSGNIIINNLSITPSNPKHGYHLLGNPYPSYLDPSSAFLGAENFETTIWYRTYSNGSYLFKTYNYTAGIGQTGTTANIPPMQSFWVRVTDSSNNIVLNDSMRSHYQVGDSHLKSNQNNEVIRIFLSNNTHSDEAIVLFNTNSGSGYTKWDSEKQMSGNVPQLWSMENGKNLSINSLPEIHIGLSIPLFMNIHQQGAHQISFQLDDFSGSDLIILEDKLLNTFHDIRSGAYLFNSQITSNEQRFTLHFNNISLAAELLNFESICSNEHVIYIWTTASETNSSLFILERTKDGQTYEPIAIVDANENSNTVNHYSVQIPSHIANGKTFRLSEMSVDGEMTILAYTKSDCQDNNSKDVHIYPNPFDTFIDITFHNTNSGVATLSISNLQKQTVHEETIVLSPDQSTYSIGTSHLHAAGIYIINIQTNDKMISKKILKL